MSDTPIIDSDPRYQACKEGLDAIRVKAGMVDGAFPIYCKLVGEMTMAETMFALIVSVQGAIDNPDLAPQPEPEIVKTLRERLAILFPQAH